MVKKKFSKTMCSVEFGFNENTKIKKSLSDNTSSDLIKSENDFMEYRLIQLDNGLKAILVSDVRKIIDLNDNSSGESDEENSNKSFSEVEEQESEGEDNESKHAKEAEEKMAACALCIGVGSFSDPPDIPGLAHFLEHMVFMGSKKYPKENGFDEFIEKHGGSDNGSTECETTTFYLECNEKYLREGMDRFAQFFISPLMISEAMTREREIIHSEFEMSLPSDETRREQILGSLAPQNHPASKFLWGNLTTLRTNIDDQVLYERVHEFRKRHYSAHRMTVAVQARLSLDTLEKYVKESFSDIPSNNLPPDNFSSYIGSFGSSDTFNRILWVKPIKDVCQIYLTWVLPPYLSEYKSRPLDYLGWLVGHEGKGSLLYLLRKKVWALQCEAGNDESGFEYNSIYSFFSISLVLTENGYSNLNEVIKLIFTYILMLKMHCPSKAIYDELRRICDTNFRYKTEIPSANYVEILAESMHIYEPKHYIAGGELYFEYKPELIKEILNNLTPDKVNIIIYSKDKKDSFYDKIEPWFKTKYKIDEIPDLWKESWLNCSLIEDFHIPVPNPYLTSDFSILNKPETNPPYPVKILDNNLLEIWYRQDLKFKQPLAYYSFYIISPLIKMDPINPVFLDILSSYFDAKFTGQIFPANQAGLYCTYYPADLGLCLQLSGYNEKLPLLFDQILILIHKCCKDIKNECNRSLFNAIKKEKSRSYYNKFIKPRKLVKMARLSILVDNYWTAVEYRAELPNITLEKLHDFANQFFQNVRIVGLIQGNVSQEKSVELCEKFQTILQCCGLEGEKPHVLVTKLQEGESYLRLKSFNESDSNSVITNYYQVGVGNIRTSCLIDLLLMIMDEPLFDNLRTKQQIGYDVHSLLRDTFGVLAFSITVYFQSHKFSPEEVDERIEEFLKVFLKILQSMSKKEWEEAKTSLCLLKSSADLQLQDEVKRNFAEICSNEYLFDRLKREVETIPQITHEELCNWFIEHIALGSKFKKLSVQVIGKPRSSNDSISSQENIDEKEFQLTTMTSSSSSRSRSTTTTTTTTTLNNEKKFFITDIPAFKNAREFYPPKHNLQFQ